MKQAFAIIFGIVLFAQSSIAQIQLTSGTETLNIDITGITDLKQVIDPQGNPTSSYTYRRSGFNLDMTINPRITIIGGTCLPTGYYFGQMDFLTQMVVGFYKDENYDKYWPVVTPAADELLLTQASGTTGFSGQIDFSRHYKTQHSLTIYVRLYLWDWNGCPTASQNLFEFWLYPEATIQEFMWTAQANEAGSDKAFWKQGNCNACNKKGVPGFSVSTVSLMPGFSDQDYAYSSLGPDIDFSRYFNNPGTMGMFGDGWNFVYEQELLASKKMVQYQNGTGVNEVYGALNDTISPYTYTPSFSNRKRLLYYPTESRYEIFDPDTKLYSDFQLYATENDTMRFHLSRIRDMSGNMITLTYNSQQKISSVTDAAGRSTSFQYGAGDRCSRMTLPDGRSCTYQYNALGQLTGVIDIYANDVGFTYDSVGYVTSMKVNENTATFTYYYSGLGGQFLTSVTNLDGNTAAYYPDVIGQNMRWNRITDPSGKATVYEINPLTGSTIAIKDVETGARQEMIYDENKMLTDFILPSGDTSKTVYDTQKRIQKTIDYRGMTSVFRFDSLDNRIEFTDAEGNTWKWFYNEQCNVKESRTPLGKSETFTYYPNGLVKTHTIGSLQTYTYAYDAYGNISSMTYPTGGIGLYEYDPMGLRCTGYTDPNGNRTTYEFDALDRITKLTHPDGSVLTTMYDCCAPTGTMDENGNTTWVERTPLLRITKSTDADGNAWNYTLDGAGRMVEKIRPDNTKYQFAYNSMGNMSKETDPFEESVRMEYDLNGLLGKITDQSGNVSSFLRSKNGKVISVAIGSNVSTFNHDSLDRITSFVNSRGQTVNYDYTADGLIHSLTSADITNEFNYDDLNRLSSANNSTGSVSLAYNGRNAISQLTYDGSRQFNFDYDLNNSLIKTRYSDNSEAIVKRDNRGRITSLVFGTDSAGFRYDAASNLTGIHRSNGVSTLIRRNKTSKITALCFYNQADSLMKWNYLRNEMGYIIREERTGSLSGDPVFMPGDTGGFYQQGNQLSQWRDLAYGYDNDGNLTQVDPGVFTASYDNLNRLTGWTQDGGNVTAHYFYNALGQVAKKQLQDGASGRIYNFYYDAENRVIEISQEGTSVGWKFFYNDKSLVACNVENGFYFYHYDQQGNTVALTDRTGNIVKTYAYDVWGKIVKETGTLDQPFKYSGAWGVMHEYNYLYRMPFRFYDSYTGKFIHRDPSGFQDGVNLYRYAQNNPVNYIDPSGLEGGDGSNEPSEEDEKSKYFNNNEYGRNASVSFDDIFNINIYCGMLTPPAIPPPLPPSAPDDEKKKRDEAAEKEAEKNIAEYNAMIQMLLDLTKSRHDMKDPVGNIKD